MRFIDSFVFKYVKKDKKNLLLNAVKDLSKLSELGLSVSIKPNENVGRLRLELYETDEVKDLLLFKGLLFTSIDEIDFSLLRDYSEISLPNGIILDYKISEVLGDIVKGLILDNDFVYAVVDEEKTNDFTNKELAKLVLKHIVEDIFEGEFNEDNYEIEIETEITDYFI
ncbi:hypothetical protein SU69_06520 [Thermosipho melanesiensis]|uniref:Uncharacterized protein n=2 Tax=Thermosipho melanesiensis TaxID=46541 RepID=A6LMI5_THEM4|nr:hypothetical protein [Thermosipho melanesiensis]ABR31136.1 hypothetical protein Tmel_1287 [Thermosipho melanesiensis BI429]APT74227.1 hypothetical protein BW47_06840 [Thermosipho melanesiensis]OOC36169.1 hypothetical protein SU68_06590 [Thermosipho melanesiensis]OOC36987.1 hypothetical protein SU69_06520 [Thermosipho melanesiensis]OOC37739.1 hypothetical protein SU70_06530 [Thermosipho melanesiensis]